MPKLGSWSIHKFSIEILFVEVGKAVMWTQICFPSSGENMTWNSFPSSSHTLTLATR